MSRSVAIHDIVIAGGGYAGLALGLSLRRVLGDGASIAIVEQRAIDRLRPTTPDPRAFAIAEGSRALLETIGVWERVEGEAEAVEAIDITDSRLEDAIRPVLLSYDNTIGGRAQTHIVNGGLLASALLDAALEAKGPAMLIAPASIARLEDDRGPAVLSLADGRVLRAHLVVAADGARSRVREASGIGVNRLAHNQTGIVTTVRLEKPHNRRAVQHFLPAGPFAMLPLAGNQCCITWSESAERAEQILGLDDARFRDEIQSRAGWRFGQLALAGARASWPLEGIAARRLTSGRIALVGDAARTVHPIAGQGVNLALRDVAALTEAVAEGMRIGLSAGDATVLERYQRWRGFDGAQSAAVFAGLNGLFSTSYMPARILRDAGLGLVNRLPGLKQLLVAEAAGVAGDVPRLLKGEIP